MPDPNPPTEPVEATPGDQPKVAPISEVPVASPGDAESVDPYAGNRLPGGNVEMN
jgi:hypothetical protein